MLRSVHVPGVLLAMLGAVMLLVILRVPPASSQAPVQGGLAVHRASCFALVALTLWRAARRPGCLA